MIAAFAVLVSLSIPLIGATVARAGSPHQGDRFEYDYNTYVDQSTGAYGGYSEQMRFPPSAPVQPVPPAAVQAPLLGTSWYVWHGYWVYRPIGWYIATHPVHVHTVAAFG